MEREEWTGLLADLARQRDVVLGWPESAPDPDALRCEHSSHRTLAHLRAAQEQWLEIVREFVDRDNPNVTVIHPWRQFDQKGYDKVPWVGHREAYAKDREEWLRLADAVDWNRGGKWNRKADTIGGLTSRLAGHELHHIKTLRQG